MWLSKLFKKKKTVSVVLITDFSGKTGKDFEFLIRGDIQIIPKDFDRIMMPNTLACNKVIKQDWIYYQVGADEFTYSWEIPGIQMTFNNEITFEKAKLIVDEVINNLSAIGQKPELVILDKSNVYNFD